MAYKTCDNCGSRIFEHGCVNCNESEYISMHQEPIAVPLSIRAEGEKDCSKHKKGLFGHSDMKEVAEAIGDLHYEVLATLLLRLSSKLQMDRLKDRADGKIKLAEQLEKAAGDIFQSHFRILKAWEISKPFMKDKNA